MAEPPETLEGPPPELSSATSPRLTIGAFAVIARRRIGVLMIIGGAFALFAVVLAVEARTRWFPQDDLAMTELHVRDVGGSNPPLLGLVGRIGTSLLSNGSHPGPLSFYILWPFYKLFGESAWSLLAATACVHLVAIIAIIWIAMRRGGLPLALGFSAAIAAVMSYLGPSIMTQPWNPYLPLLWWFVFVLAVWSVSCGELMFLPIAAFSGSFCVQTHLSYAALVVGGAVFAVAHVVRMCITGEGGRRVRLLWWTLGALVTSAVVWIPPIYQQVTSSNGNLSLLFRYFAQPPEAPIGLRRGLTLMLVHLNPWTLISSRNILITTGSTVPGALLLVAWIASIVVAWRMKARELLRLHALVAISLAAGVWSMGRIFGFVWYYDVLWAWCLCGLLDVALITTLVMALGRSERISPSSLLQRLATPVLIVAVVGLASPFLVDAFGVEVPPSNTANAFLAKIVRPTLAVLKTHGTFPGVVGRGGVYLVTEDDPVLIGAHAFALVDELVRDDFHVGMLPGYEEWVGPQRILQEDQATAIVHIAVGETDIQHWEHAPGAHEVVEADPATPLERQRFNELRNRVLSQLAADRLNTLGTLIDNNLFAATSDPRIPPALHPMVVEMAHIGLPEAVFTAPIIPAGFAG